MIKRKKYARWLSFFMILALTVGCFQISVKADVVGTGNYSVNFGTGSWTVGGVTVTADRSGTQTLLETDEITLTGFNSDTMVAKITATDGFSTKLTVVDGKTSISKKEAASLPGGTLTFTVEAKSNEGGNGGNGGQTYSVNFETGSWTVGDVTVTANKTGTQTLSETDEITLTGFNSETMEVKITATDGFSTKLTVVDGKTSISQKEAASLPGGTLTFTVEAKSNEGGNGGNGGQTYSVNFETGSWTVGEVTVTADRSGTQTLSETDEITLTGFNSDTMVAKITEAESRFNTTLRVTEGKTSISQKEADGLPGGTWTFTVEAKPNEGGNGGNGDRTYNVNFGNGSWTVGNVTVYATDSEAVALTETKDISDTFVIELTNFNPETMDVKIVAASGFNTILLVNESGETSLSTKPADSNFPNEALTFSVVDKSSGGNNEGGGEQGGGNTPITDPIDITVTISEGLDLFGINDTYLKVDGKAVKSGETVTVQKASTHKISVLEEFGIELNSKAIINGNEITGSMTNDHWYIFTVDEATTYDMKISGKNPFYTVVWDYGNAFGDDAVVDNGTVSIKSAILDGEDAIVSSSQDSKGGHVAIKPGSLVTVEIKPDYGYQFLKGSLNGQEIVAGATVSTFTFTMPETNLHLSALFTKTDDIIKADSKQVSSGSLANGENVVDSGNLKLQIEDLTAEEIATIDDKMKEKAGADEVQLYLDMDLYNVINKGNTTDAWENQLKELDGDLTVTLELSDELKGKDGTFYVIREHTDDKGVVTYSKLKATYDPKTGKISFATNKFSKYALVLEKNVNTTDAKNNACNADLDESSEDLVNKVLTTKEKEDMNNGAEVKVYLEVKDISSTVSKEDKELIDDVIGYATVGTYFDIDLYKKVGANNAVLVTETNGKVKVTLKVPTNLLNNDSSVTRTYQMVRVHNGVATLLPCKFDEKTGTLTMETDQFSTYALVYKDTVNKETITGDNGGEDSEGEDTENNTTNTTNNIVKNTIGPKTSDSNTLMLWIVLAIISGVGIICFVSKKKGFLKK